LELKVYVILIESEERVGQRVLYLSSYISSFVYVYDVWQKAATALQRMHRRELKTFLFRPSILF